MGKLNSLPKQGIFFFLSVSKLLFKFSLVAGGGVTPFAEVFYFAVLFTGNDGIIAFKGVGTIIIFDDLSFPVKALAGIITSREFIKILDSCHYCGLLCFVVLMIAQGKKKVNKKKIKSCKTNQRIKQGSVKLLTIGRKIVL